MCDPLMRVFFNLKYILSEERKEGKIFKHNHIIIKKVKTFIMKKLTHAMSQLLMTQWKHQHACRCS